MAIPTSPTAALPAVPPDLVASALDKLRLRLLDLTLANRLLSFKHTRKSALRVVDELPDVLWNRLQNGDELAFVPVPEPPAEHYIVETDQGRSAQAPGDAPAARKPTPREYAETMGLATSFELPRPPEGEAKPKPSHRDKLIQTLHYPDELEAMLRAIGNSSRSAIEETGSNMLFLVFGFLEWREAPRSETPLLAPLLTLPVSMRRGDVDSRTRTFRYFVSYSGEDPGYNVSLHEKMRRDFGIALPMLDDGEVPEAYFERVRLAVADAGAWQVRRQITLTLLSFGKLLMYRDLDPARWPEGREPSSHPRVRELLAGAERLPGQVSGEVDLDAQELAGQLPPIVVDADSSQHSALVDAMRGRSIVVQGPPGTGKSQTIANLIAASMLAGKTVLFVSEKLAALEVVRRRLDAAGLGAFCLELHSHKTQKQEFLKDIAARIEARGSFRDPADLDAQLEVLSQSRDRLIGYARALHEPFGASKRSAFELVWSSERMRAELGALADRADELEFPDSTAWPLSAFEQCREQVGAYAEHLDATRAAAKGAARPWRGVTRPARDADEQRSYVQSASSAAELAAKVAECVATLREAARLELGDKRSELELFVSAARAVPTAAAHDGAILVKLGSDEARAHLAHFLESLERWLAARAAISGKVTAVPSEHAQLEAYRAAAATIASEASRALTLGHIAQLCTGFEAVAPRLAWFESLRAHVSATLGAPVHATLRGAIVALDCIAAARLAPLESLHLRNVAADPETTEHVFRAAVAEAQALWQQAAALSQHFELSLLPDPATITRHLGACATAGPLKFLDAAYQAAQKCYATISKSHREAEPEEMARAFQQLATYATRAAAFQQNADYRAVIGPAFRGTATPFQEVASVRAWQLRVIQGLSRALAGGPDLARKLVASPPEVLRQLATIAPDVDAFRNELNALAQQTSADERLASIASAISERAAGLRSAASFLAAAGFVPACETATLPSLVGSVEAYVTLHGALQNDATSKDILGEVFAGATTSPAMVRDALRIDAALQASRLPAAWSRWLRDEQSQQRIARIHEAAERVAALVPRLDAAHLAWMQLAAVDASAWYDGGPGWGAGASAASVAARFAEALSAAEQLASWSSLLRTRQSLIELGLGAVSELAERGDVPATSLWPFCEYGLTRRLARDAIDSSPILASFDGTAHGQTRDRFRRYDTEVIRAFRARAAWLVDQRPVPEGVRTGPVAGHSDLGLLEHECRKQRRHIPIRQLLSRAGRALQALKPCFMMGPRSVAQYLEPASVEFDLLVVDEASQLRPEDAFGAICRAKQSAMFGDPMQLPPTSFFDRMGDEEDIDEADVTPVDDSESILDVAASAWSPIRRLKWHYRSRHESLIAFSNTEFYEGQLVVFPSPLPLSDDLGVAFALVSDGVYEAGRNVIEAERVVDALVDHILHHPKESVGVATMNFKQRDLIDELLQRRAKTDPAIASAIDLALAGLEPMFIKNLENVQGDERDVIIVSVTYGKDKSGKLYQRFGPLNGAAGPRRLNVLFSRARRRVGVLCSFEPEELVGVDSSSPDGAGVLKRYLAFAKARSSSTAITAKARPTAFDAAVGRYLEERGLRAVAQVGLASAPIDLAAGPGASAGRFTLAVESDGPRYRAAHSTRDRDRLRQSALESMGWAVERVWTVQWFRDRARVLDTLARKAE